MALENLVVENEYVLVESTPEKEKTMESGIIIKTIVEKEELFTGKVAAISAKCDRELIIQLGDIAYFTEDGIRSRIKYDDKSYYVVKESNILAYTRD